MIIAHIAPFAPNRCGLFEHARDLARADIAGGNQVIFIDAGITVNGKRENPIIGGVDDRAGFCLKTGHPDDLNQADIIIQHTGCPDLWTVKNQAPLLWVIHGRPLACFRSEQNGKGNSYSLYHSLSRWPRTKKMIHFWPEFQKYWNAVIPEEKLLCLDFPVIDETRFNDSGDVHTLTNPGKYNFLICDSSREDIDLFELVSGCVEASRHIEGLKFHFYGFDFPLPNCWNILLGKLKELGALGDLVGRVQDMEKVCKACDCLISPNRIITRTIAEALSCGIPVIAEQGCKVADYTCYFPDLFSVSNAIEDFTLDMDYGRYDKAKILDRAKCFNMKNYYEKMNKVYKEL